MFTVKPVIREICRRSTTLSAPRYIHPRLANIETVPLVSEVIQTKTQPNPRSPPPAPIVLLHGFLGNKANNRTLAKLLNERLQRNVYSLDLRNHGKSPTITRHDYDAMTADVAQWIKEHNILSPIIIGHSMGAKVAMSLVLHHQQLCSMLVSVENSPVSVHPQSIFTQYITSLQQITQNEAIQSYQQADEHILKMTGEKSILVRQFLTTLLQKYKDPLTTNYRYKERVPLSILKDAAVKGTIMEWNLTPDTYNWAGPTLFIRGTGSSYIPDDYLPAIATFFPKFEVRDVAAGHWITSEKPVECADLIVDFVERHEDN